MKIRIKGNSIRLRLDQNEVEQFQETGIVNSSITFWNNLTMNYALVRSEVQEPLACMTDNNIEVLVPEQQAIEWTTTDLVGFKNKVSVQGNTELTILVEKDFQCVTPREDEDESKNFPNPLTEC